MTVAVYYTSIRNQQRPLPLIENELSTIGFIHHNCISHTLIPPPPYSLSQTRGSVFIVNETCFRKATPLETAIYDFYHTATDNIPHEHSFYCIKCTRYQMISVIMNKFDENQLCANSEN